MSLAPIKDTVRVLATSSSESFSTPPSPSAGAVNWCCTQVDLKKINFIWAINNFSLCLTETGDYLRSQQFFDGPQDCEKWRLQLCPKGDEYLSLYLDCSKSEVRAKFKFYVLNDEKEKINIKESRPKLFGNCWGYPRFIQRNFLFDEANRLLFNDTLTICCDLTVIGGISNTSGKSNSTQFQIPGCRLAEDLETLFNSEKFSDVTLKVGQHDIRAHKALLASRSKVFAAIFEYEMEEAKSNHLVVKDVDHDIFKEMLHFMYTEKVPNLNEKAVDLLIVADKYALEKLKTMCEEVLWQNLSPENSPKMLILADQHNAIQLKTQTINFIKNNFMDVMKSPAWNTMISIHPKLVAETLQAIIRQQKEKGVKGSRVLDFIL